MKRPFFLQSIALFVLSRAFGCRISVVFIIVAFEFLTTRLGDKDSNPGRQDGNTLNGGPPLLTTSIVWLNAASTCNINDVDETVDDDVGNDTSDDTVC
jgi:hypothetical protein